MKKLTDDQRRFATENHNLIYKFLKSRNLPIDEFYDIVAIGYVKAVASFNPDIAQFSTYSYRAMENAVKAEQRKRLAKFRIPEMPICSLDFMVEDADGDGCELYSLVSDRCCEQWEDEVHTKVLIDDLSDREKRIVEMKLSGMDQKEIGQELGLTQSYISRLLKTIKQNIT